MRQMDEKRRTILLVIGNMINGRYSTEADKFIIKSPISLDEERIIEHISILRAVGKDVTPDTIIKSISKEPWAASLILDAYKDMVNDLSEYANDINEKYGRHADVAIKTLSNGKPKNRRAIESVISMDILKAMCLFRNATLVYDRDSVSIMFNNSKK